MKVLMIACVLMIARALHAVDFTMDSFQLAELIQALSLAAYLAVVVWALLKSSRRWMTLLRIVVSLVSVVFLGYLLTLAVPRYGLEIVGFLGIIAMLVSAAVGWNYTRTHRRTPPPSSNKG